VVVRPADQVSHGLNGKGSVPDLRKASSITHKLFAGIVLGGLYKDMGMPVFQGAISPEELQALQSYI
jgi:hypothetical protein